MCEWWTVICGYCGNNVCNGGSGNPFKGIKCDCKEAHEIMHNYNELMKLPYRDNLPKRIFRWFHVKICGIYGLRQRLYQIKRKLRSYKHRIMK